MTIQKIGDRKKIKRRGITSALRGAIPTIGVLFCMALFLRNPTLGRDAVTRGLQISARNVIPSVFPFLVFSDLLLSGGALPERFTKGMQSLLRLPAAGCTAILLGWVCGFPIGALGAMRGLKDGTLTTTEAERVIAISCVPSPAFLIGSVGVGLFGDRGKGIFLYTAVLLAALTVGFFSARLQKGESTARENSIPPIPDPFPLRLTEAIRKSALSSLNICAFIVFFSAVSGAVEAVLTRFGANPYSGAVLSALLELSGGAASAAALDDPRAAMILCGAAAGWAGLSVHFQILSVCHGQRLRFGRYFLAKGLQGLLCALMVTAWLLFHG